MKTPRADGPGEAAAGNADGDLADKVFVRVLPSAMPDGTKTEGGTVWAASAGQADEKNTAKLRLTVPPNPVARGIALQMAEELQVIEPIACVAGAVGVNRAEPAGVAGCHRGRLRTRSASSSTNHRTCLSREVATREHISFLAVPAHVPPAAIVYSKCYNM